LANATPPAIDHEDDTAAPADDQPALAAGARDGAGMAGTPSVLGRVRRLASAACEHYGEEPAGDALVEVASRLDEALRVAIVGRVRAGKSTLLNALVGQELAATDAGKGTQVVTWYREGLRAKITL